ncbi:MAG: RNA pseudouridine synthase [Acidobacteria bacterium]|nr:RNA pseudouridine synthase [Acidobacteriota bacterium]
MPVRIVDRTPGAVVVVKPAGLASELPRDPTADSLLRRLARGGDVDLKLVHRLDAPACGLVLVARSKGAAAHYAREIEARRWLKWYVARVPVPLEAARRLVGAHKAFLRTQGRLAAVVRSGGRPSFLDVVLATPVPDGTGDSHLLIQLRTGRFHQIRAMLASLGAPLTGDASYGGAGDRPLYLEHVVLASYADTSGAWTVWEGPVHADREAWTAELAAAVAAHAVRARTAPPPRDSAP